MQVPTIIDFEASGFGKNSYPIEVGFVTETGQGWCSLIKPEEDWRHWDAAAEEVHHISRENLIRHGKSCVSIAHQLNQVLQDRVVYTDGWVHDYIWMARLFDAANTSPHFQLEDLRYVLTNEQESRWHAAKAFVQDDIHAIRHRASTDARVLQLTWLRTCGSE
jgi:hypothetical protein